MKAWKQAVTGVRVLILLLLGYSVLITVSATILEQGLRRLKASNQELLVRHRILENTLTHVRVTPELLANLKEAMAQESPGRPAFTDRELLRLIGTEINSPLPGARSK